MQTKLTDRHSVDISNTVAEKPDLDFWYNPTYDNYFRLLNALEELGQDVSEFKAEQTPDPKKSFFRYDCENFTLDLLPGLKAPIKFRAAYERKEAVTLKDVDIMFLSFDDLKLDKRTDSRPKDINGIEQLENKRKRKG